VISIGAFAHPAEVTQRTLRRLRLPRFVTLLVIRYVEWVIGHRFEAIAPVNTVCRITCPLLLVHGRETRPCPWRTRGASRPDATRPRYAFW